MSETAPLYCDISRKSSSMPRWMMSAGLRFHSAKLEALHILIVDSPLDPDDQDDSTLFGGNIESTAPANPFKITAAEPSKSRLAEFARLKTSKHCTCRQIRENDL